LAALRTRRLHVTAGIEYLRNSLAQATGLPALTSLDLSGTSLSADAVAALARGPLAAQLGHLDLSHCFQDARAAAALATGDWEELETLTVGLHFLAEETRETLTSRFGDRVRF